MQVTELKGCFKIGRSIFSIFAQLYPFCIHNERELYNIRDAENSKLEELDRRVGMWINDLENQRVLTEQRVRDIHEIIDNIIWSDQDVMLFSSSLLRKIDKHYEFLARQSQSGIDVGILNPDTKYGYVGIKHSDYPRIIQLGKGKVPRARDELWAVDFSSELLHFIVIPHKISSNQNVSIHITPNPLFDHWHNTSNFQIGISQLSPNPIITIFEESHHGIKFCIKECTDPNQLFQNISAQLQEAFIHRLDILLLPELVFPDELEEKLLAELKHLSHQHSHSLAIVIGYLHLENDLGRYINIAKVIMPKFDDVSYEVQYEVLYTEVKKEPVWITKGSRGLEVISEVAVEKGLIENIHIGDTWNIIESPIGRICVVICKDFLSMSDQFIRQSEIDVILVCAMTPKMIGDFEARANNVRNIERTIVAISNNGYYVNNKGKEEAFYSYVTAPFVNDGTPYEWKISSVPNNNKVEIYKIGL